MNIAVVSVVFWLLLGLVFYTYIGYALLLLIVRTFKKQPVPLVLDELPPLTLVIAAYNEEAVLAAKIENTLSLNYPVEKLTVLVVTDGSTDASLAILKKYPSIKVLHAPERRGKAAAINRAMQQIDTPFVVFSDANTTLNPESLQQLIKHFADEKVGAVAGEKKVAASTGMGSAEGWYWQYESFIKKLDASFYTVLGAAGELFALRTKLFMPLPEDTILDDFILSMQVCQRGFKIAYEPQAYALEAPSVSLTGERKRKIRIASGAFQALRRLSLSRVLTKPALLFQFISRRWLRWVICPPALIALLLLNIVLVLFKESVVYQVMLGLQILFYLLALVGWQRIRQNKVSIVAVIPFYFVFMNYCVLLGLLHFWQGKGTVLWTKAERLPTFPLK